MKAYPTKKAIARYWAGRRDHDFVLDENELSCFACGNGFDGRYDANIEKIPLEKAHIVPRADSGANSVDNFVLLCRECHALAPMSVSRKRFLQWVHLRPNYLVSRMQELERAYKAFGVDPSSWPPSKLDAITDQLRKKRFSAHGHPIVGLTIPVSSFVAEMADLDDRYFDGGLTPACLSVMQLSLDLTPAAQPDKRGKPP